ncbi:Rpn family recombination-promoting nuclease/putative transposase [Treponema sp.]|uniref:Rpn family recombination-promoting nuclease/putative transposase n=1 Tax=Treponema sp. TaxID=166 RepID=UPI00298DFCF2|nr:Rpn family recombination-promoting nuclease/putative transposase [Treponema sp.]MCR5613690.1 Rpn family recombination-promoting nuclease/putative transposase [Treponema sp.]
MEERIIKPIEELTFTDDGMFQAVLHEPGICAELVERLLHINVGRIEYPELEKTIAPFYTTKGVRLDVYLKDEDKIIDIEIQSYRQEKIGKRSRYYQSMIDMDSLMKGQGYPTLKDSYILFICKQDPFLNDRKKGYGLPCYTFKNICLENSAVNLNDKAVKVFYNATAHEAEKDEKIKAFLHFISTNDPAQDDFSKRLASFVEKIKDTEKFRRDYAAMNLHDWDLTQLVKKETIKEKAIEDIKNFYANGVSLEIIAKSMNMTIDEIKDIIADKEVAEE